MSDETHSSPEDPDALIGACDIDGSDREDEPLSVANLSHYEGDSDQENPPNAPASEYHPVQFEERRLNPGVRYYNFRGFMNRVESDHADFCIEVLVTRPDWHEDVETELARSDVLPRPQGVPRPRTMIPPSEGGTESEKSVERSEYPPPPPLAGRILHGRRLATNPYDNPEYGHNTLAENIDIPLGSETPLEGRLMRVRLRSPLVLQCLASVSKYSTLSGRPAFEFQRPFRLFEESYEGMKLKLAEMEQSQIDASETQDGGRDSDAHVTNHRDAPATIDTHVPTREFQTEENIDTQTPSEPVDLQDMRCFINFIEQRILPIRERFRDADSGSHLQVCFEDIPYLFHSGTLAFLPQQTKSSRGLHRSAAQQIWRMVTCIPAAIPSPYNRRRSDEEEDPCEFTKWSLYSLDYDGDTVVPVWKTVFFQRFKGERKITSLECYPLRFSPEQVEIMEEQTKAGRLFTSCVTSSVKHHYYSGWTFIRGIHAEPLEDDNGDSVQHPEHIESEVVIDFKEALRSHPRWETELGNPLFIYSDWDYENYADIPLRTWQKTRTRRYGRLAKDESSCILTMEDHFYKLEANAWADQDRFLTGEAEILEKIQSDEDVSLLPKRIFAYVLRERKFARLEVSGIELNTGKSVVTLDDIQMREDRRKMIRSAVSTHFRDRRGLSKLELDAIRGKGSGLVILLHGAPGVGKTATAEAVAAENKRPLFPITCGDLGSSPGAVEKSLRDIFRHAHLWNCVLLFDEADVFLTQRDRSGGNLERNALVGVFLRVLEYYSGILFLTTNRVGALDEAFQSRVHLSLCYPHLTLEDTLQILESNLNRLPREDKAEDRTALDGYLSVSDKSIKEFVTSEYKKYSKRTGKKRGPWNGRQIRNAVQIAAGIAFYEKEIEMEGKRPNGLPATLTAQHFKEVAETTSEFEKYLKATKAADEEYLARHRADRADNWDDEEEEYPSYQGHSDGGGYYAPKRGSFSGNMRGRASPGRGRLRAGHEPSSNPDRSRHTISHRSERGGSQYSTPARPSPGMRGRGQQHAPQDNRPRYPQEFHERYENEENPDDLQDEYADEEEYDQEYDDWGHTHPSPASHRGMKSPGSHAGKGRL